MQYSVQPSNIWIDTAMPSSLLTEFVLRPIAEGVVHVFGYLTGLMLVPMLTLGRYQVEALMSEQRPRPKSWKRQPKQPLPPHVISADDAVLVGMLFWVVVVAAFALIWHLSK